MANWYVDSVKYAAVSAWAASHAYTTGTIVRQLATPSVGNERCFVCTTAGTSGSTEPTWNVSSAGQTTTDGGVTWTECSGKNTYNGDGGGSAFGAPHARVSNANSMNWLSSGDTVVVAAEHSETWASAPTLVLPEYFSAANLCVASGVAPPTAVTTGGTVTITGTGSCAFGNQYNGCTTYTYGLNFVYSSGSSQGNFVFNNNNFGKDTYESCTFNISNTSSSSYYQFGTYDGYPHDTKFVNCSFLFGAAGQTIVGYSQGNSQIVFQGCSFASSGTVPTYLFTGTNNGAFARFLLKDCDLSAITTTLFSYPGNSGGSIDLQNCKLASGVTLYSGTPDNPAAAYLRMANCDSGSTNYRYYYRAWGGACQSETTVVRSGGATNGATSESWKITTDSNPTLYFPFYTDELGIWSTFSSGAHSATIYLASTTSLTNGQVWAEVEYPGVSGYPQNSVASSRMSLLGTASTLTTDTSSWGGSETYFYKIVVSFTPVGVGPVKARLAVAVPSVTIYADPVLYLS